MSDGDETCILAVHVPNRKATIEAISAASLDAVIAIDHDDLIIAWNDTAERTFGWRSEDVVGTPLGSTIIPHVDRDAHTNGLSRYKQTGVAAIFGKRFERDALCADGSTIRVELSIMRVGQDDEEALVCFVRDLTDELVAKAAVKDLQSQLIHLSRTSAMSTMASTIAHELNQPLTAASNYLRGIDRLLADEQSPRAAQAKEALQLVGSAITRAADTIRAVREMVSRGKLGQENHRLSALTMESARLLQGSLAADPVVNIPADADCISVNRVQIEQVLLNLIRNASEALAGQPHAQLSVEASRRDDMIEVRVTDNGPGLPPGTGDPFAVAGSRKANGMGIGLSISRTIIENHGGEIWFETPAIGTRVCFTVPACPGDSRACITAEDVPTAQRPIMASR